MRKPVAELVDFLEDVKLDLYSVNDDDVEKIRGKFELLQITNLHQPCNLNQTK